MKKIKKTYASSGYDFGEEVPVMMTLDGNEKTEIIINAIFDNEKIKGVKLEDDVNI